MSAGVAPGDIIIAMGSPGTTLSRTNTIVATPPKVTAAMKRRWAAEFIIHARADLPPLPLLRERAGVRARRQFRREKTLIRRYAPPSPASAGEGKLRPWRPIAAPAPRSRWG